MKRILALLILFFLAITPVLAEGSAPRLSQERVVLRTSMGDIVVALYPDNAPRHTAKFLTMARMGLYDGSIFFLVYPNYVAQVYGIRYRGRPLSPEAEAAAKPLEAETSPLKYGRGTVAFAQDLKNPLSDESSFSIFLSDTPVLNGKGTIIGEVRQGIEVAQAISRVKTSGQKHMPLDPVYLEKIEVAPDETAIPAMGIRALVERVEKRPASIPIEYLGMIVFSLGLAFVSFLAALRGATRAAASLSLLTFLSLFFLIYAAFVPQALHSPWLAVLIFLTSLFTIKLMTFFEK